MSEILTTDFLLKALRESKEEIFAGPFPNFKSLSGKASVQEFKSEPLAGVSLDSRKNVKDKLFFAVKGKNFDGHDFLLQAFDKGAKVFVVSDKRKAQSLKNKNAFVILAPDSIKALQILAQSWSRALDIKVLAVTGSIGKSTTCFFTHTLLSDFSVFVSPKSYNNCIGVPLSLLNVNKKSSFLVQEIGTSAPGEIAPLTRLCRPIASVVTMTAPSHLSALKDLESVAQEKREIYLNSPQALWIFNKDNFYTNKMRRELGKKDSICFSSQDRKAHVSLHFLRESAQKSLIAGRIGSVSSQAELLFSGQGNLDNLMCACALALAVGAKPDQIWKRLSECRLPKGRQEYFFMKDKQISVLFDAYNANPGSMDFFLKICQKFSKRRVLILGDMKDLGEKAKKYHQELARRPALLESDCIFFVGDHSALMEEELRKNNFKGYFKGAEAYNKSLLEDIKSRLKAGDLLGLKASRSLALENIAFDLTGHHFLT